MPQPQRARLAALWVLAALAGTAAAGLAALARAGAGLCDRRLFAHPGAPGAAGMMSHRMAMAGSAAPEGVCPILLYAGLAAAALCLLALGTLLAGRTRPAAVAAAAARLVLGLRLARITALLGLAGAVPLAAILVSEDGWQLAGLPALAALAALAGGALLAALALVGAARAVLGLARRLVVALVLGLRLPAPGPPPARPRRPAAGPAPAGLRLARRRPSRAPPLTA